MTLSDFFVDLENIAAKPEETYAMKSYKLIEYQPANDQRHLYNILNEIMSMHK